jgi:hypothetical protein
MPRWAWALLGSAVSWLVGGVVGVAAAIIYERVTYPPEPDPVHFDVGGVFLGVWVVVWGAGTAGSVWLAYREWTRQAAPAPPPTLIRPPRRT